MKYDFDTPVDRRGTASIKWDFSRHFTGLENLAPLWVADMDFRACEQIVQALRDRCEHGIFGYTLEPDSYYRAAIEWMSRRHSFQVKREWMISAPGVVPSLNIALQAYSRAGERVIIQPPVYYPFRESILNNGREVAENPLRLEDGRYVMDFEQLESLIDARTRLLILCSPHNPVGRVWRRRELERLVAVCRLHDIVILSDEIHHDLIMSGHRHLPTASLSGEAASQTVTFTSATKTFNLAGLGCSLVIAADERLRERFRTTLRSVWTGLANAFSCLAAETAYRHGESWLEQILEYIRGNYDFFASTLKEKLPQARVLPLEGTYLAWVDLRALGLSDRQLNKRILHQARVWLDDGPMFGAGGEGFQRVNLACPRSTLKSALEAMIRVLS